jgi:hypothetical protein
MYYTYILPTEYHLLENYCIKNVLGNYSLASMTLLMDKI